MQQCRGRLGHVRASSPFSLIVWRLKKLVGEGDFKILLVGFAQLLYLILDVGVCVGASHAHPPLP